jgi:hypothetical protein
VGVADFTFALWQRKKTAKSTRLGTTEKYGDFFLLRLGPIAADSVFRRVQAQIPQHRTLYFALTHTKESDILPEVINEDSVDATPPPPPPAAPRTARQSGPMPITSDEHTTAPGPPPPKPRFRPRELLSHTNHTTNKHEGLGILSEFFRKHCNRNFATPADLCAPSTGL